MARKPRRGNDRDAQFRQIYDENSHLILGYAIRRTRSAELAVDVVSEVFLVAWRRFDDVPTGDATRLWLYGVARRVLANSRRSERRRVRLQRRIGEEVAAQLRRFVEPPAVNQSRDILEAFSELEEQDREFLGLQLGSRSIATRSRLRSVVAEPPCACVCIEHAGVSKSY